MTILMRVRVAGTGWTGAPGLITAYFSGSTTPTGAECTEAVARVRASFTSMAAFIPNTITWLVNPQVDLIDDATGVLSGSQVVTTVAGVTGTQASNLAATSTTAVCRFLTNTVISGRRLQGRSNLGPIGVASLDAGGLITSAARTAISTGYGQYVVQVLTPITHRVWHRPGPLGPGSSAASTSNTVNQKPGVLRSRRD